MEICTANRSHQTALLPRVLEAGSAWRTPADVQGRGDICALVLTPSVEVGGIALADMAASAPVVTDHTYSTRPGSPSCSPPV
jgi:hypothetical protein